MPDPHTAPAFDRGRTSSPIWLQPVSLFVYAAALMVAATVFLTLWKIRQKQAERVFQQIVVRAQRTENPRESASMYEGYINTHPQNAISREARRKRDEALSQVPAYDFATTFKKADAAGKQYESVEQILRDYLATDPLAQYRQKAEVRLRALPGLIEARDYAVVEDRYPESATDLRGREAALREFLSRHPTGLHADAAQRALATMADRLDEQALTELKQKVTSLGSERKYEQALQLLDAEVTKIKAEQRKKSLEEMRKNLLASQMDHEVDTILAAPTTLPADQDQAMSDARLFLLCHPGSPQASRIKKFLDEVSRQKQVAEWADVQFALSASRNDLARCLDLIGVFQSRWPEPGSPEIGVRIAEYHLQNLKQAWAELDVIETGILVRKGGVQHSGRIERSNSSFRVIDTTNGKRTSPIYPSEIQEIKLQPGPGTMKDITDAIERIEVSKFRPPDLRPALETIEKSGLKRAGLLVRRFLVGLNPRDAECSKALLEAGCKCVRGRWLLPEEQSPKLRVQNVLENCREKLVESAKFLVAHLDLKVTYDFDDYAVQCTVAYVRTEIGRLSEPGQPLKASAQIVFTPMLRLKDGGSRGQDEAEQSAGLTAALRRLGSNLECVADLEIEETPSSWLGAEIELPANDGGFLVGPIAAGSVADRAWLEQGDELLTINELKLTQGMTLREVRELVAGMSAQPVNLMCKRRGHTFNVTVEPQPQSFGILKGKYRFQHNIGKERITGSWIDFSASDR